MINISIIGCDSTHAEAFGELCKDKSSPFGGYATIYGIWDSNIKLAEKKGKLLNAKIIGSTIDEVVKNTDVILLLNRFGEERFELAKKLVKYKKPVFADKPLTMDIKEAKMFVNMFKKNNVPLFSASAFRYSDEIIEVKKRIKNEKIVGGVAVGPCICNDLGDDQRLKNVVFYGVHLCEMVQEVFGGSFKIDFLKKFNSTQYTANLFFPQKFYVNLSFIKQTQDYYTLKIFTDKSIIDCTIDLNKNYYKNTLEKFLKFCDGSFNFEILNTIEALNLILKINRL